MTPYIATAVLVAIIVVLIFHGGNGDDLANFIDSASQLPDPYPPTPAGQAESYARRLGGGMPLKLAVSAELFESYAVPGTPYGLLIDRDGIVRSRRESDAGSRRGIGS